MARDELVYCRTCGARIARSAKKCPYCGARQKKRHVLRNVILILLVLCIVYYAYNEGMTRRSQGKYNGGHDPASAVTTATEKQTDAEEKETTKQTAAGVMQEGVDDVQTQTDENGVSLDFKEFMDSYESFMNEYCDFMATYDESDLSALTRYLSLVSKYTDFASRVDSYNEDNLSAADYKYYIDVMARVNKKLIDTSVTVDQQAGE